MFPQGLTSQTLKLFWVSCILTKLSLSGMKDALISRNIFTSGQKVSLKVLHVKEPHAENRLSKCEEQERTLGLLCRVGVLLIVFKDTRWCLWLVQDSQVHPILYPPGDGALTWIAATVLCKFV